MNDIKLIKKLKEVLAYDPETGVFTWKVSINRSIKVGAVVGTLHHSGYINIQVDGKKYRAHRIAFAFIYGYFPKEIDHRNRNKSDNRVKNLREVTHKENQKNKSMMSNNTSGFNGVVWHKKADKWQSRIIIDGKTIFLGYFTRKQDAIQARKEANMQYGFYKGHGLKRIRDELL